jgi:AsmA protein
MKKIFIILLSLILVLIVAALTVPVLIPADRYKSAVLDLLSEKTGRSIQINGGLSFTLLPDIALKAEQVSIGNPEGFTSPYFLTVEEIRFSLRLKELLQKRVEVSELTLLQPDINLEKNPAGQGNWEFNPPRDTGSQAASDTTSSKPMQFNIDKIAVDNGIVKWKAPGTEATVENLNAAFAPSYAELTGDVAYAEGSWNIKLATSEPLNVLEGKSIPLQANIRNDNLIADFAGTVSNLIPKDDSTGQKMRAAGKLDVQMNSISEFTRRITGQASPINGGLKLTSSKVKFDQASVSLEALQAQIGKTAVSGDVSARLTGRKPRIDAKLDIPSLDTDTLMKSNKATPSNNGISAGGDGWSNEPIDLSGLNAFNLQLQANIAELKSQGHTLGNVRLISTLDDGRLGFSIPNASYAGGALSAKGVLQNGKQIRWNKDVTLKNMSAQQFFESFMPDSRITGTLNGNLSFNGSGNSLAAWMNSLGGSGSLRLSDGKVIGYSLVQMFRNIKAAFNPSPEGAGNSTEFSEISIPFTASGGILSIAEASLVSPLLRATTTGKVNLPGKTLNLYVSPKLVPSLKGQGDTEQRDITVKPDVGGAINEALKDPASVKATIDAVADEGEAIKENLEQRKDTLKEQWKQLKEIKDPASVNNILDTLDGVGLKVPKLPGNETTQNPAGSTDGGAGAGADTQQSPGADTGGTGSGSEPPAAGQTGTDPAGIDVINP